jgi:hypothetical protein
MKKHEGKIAVITGGHQEALEEQKQKDKKSNVIKKQLEAQSNQLKALISEL